MNDETRSIGRREFIRSMAVAIGLVAICLVLAFLAENVLGRSVPTSVLFLLALMIGPGAGVFFGDRCRKNGVGAFSGGMIGGIISHWMFVAGCYLCAYYWPQPHEVDLLGPGYTLVLSGIAGTATGLCVGLVFAILKAVRRRYKGRREKSDFGVDFADSARP